MSPENWRHPFSLVLPSGTTIVVIQQLNCLHQHFSKAIQVDAWAVLVNGSGNLLWSKTIGGTKEDAFTDVIVLKNKKKVLIGNSKSNDGDIKSQHGGYNGFLLLFE